MPPLGSGHLAVYPIGFRCVGKHLLWPINHVLVKKAVLKEALNGLDWVPIVYCVFVQRAVLERESTSTPFTGSFGEGIDLLVEFSNIMEGETKLLNHLEKNQLYT